MRKEIEEIVTGHLKNASNYHNNFFSSVILCKTKVHTYIDAYMMAVTSLMSMTITKYVSFERLWFCFERTWLFKLDKLLKPMEQVWQI